MKNLSILIILSLFIFCSCGKEEKRYVPVSRCLGLTENMDTINKYIQGTWEFVEEKRLTYDRNAFVFYTPNSPGWYHLTLKLSGDTARFFVNSLPDSTYKFRIQRMLEITNSPTDSFPVIVYYSFFTGLRRNAVPIMICEDQLLMHDLILSDIGGERIWIRK